MPSEYVCCEVVVHKERARLNLVTDPGAVEDISCKLSTSSEQWLLLGFAQLVKGSLCRCASDQTVGCNYRCQAPETQLFLFTAAKLLVPAQKNKNCQLKVLQYKTLSTLTLLELTSKLFQNWGERGAGPVDPTRSATVHSHDPEASICG